MSDLLIKSAENGWVIQIQEEEKLRLVLFEVSEEGVFSRDAAELAEAKAFQGMLHFLMDHYGVGTNGFSKSTLNITIGPGDEVCDEEDEEEPTK